MGPLMKFHLTVPCYLETGCLCHDQSSNQMRNCYFCVFIDVAWLVAAFFFLNPYFFSMLSTSNFQLLEYFMKKQNHQLSADLWRFCEVEQIKLLCQPYSGPIFVLRIWLMLSLTWLRLGAFPRGQKAEVWLTGLG